MWGEMDWLLYLMVFGFGYLTCRIFYFFRSVRISVSLVRTAQVVYLSAVIKALEHLSYAREIMLEHMLRTEKGSSQISSFEYRFEEEVRLLKENSVRQLVNLHPRVFHDIVQFEDWTSAMDFLTEHRGSALSFWSNKDDR